MKGYGQYCPIARGSEIFAERWTPIIVRNLSLGCHTFGQILEGAPGLSKTLLVERLRSLERAGVIDVTPNPRGRGSLYSLTLAGRDLAEVADTLGRWGARWTTIGPEDMDPMIVLWAKTKAWDGTRQPSDRIVIRFDVTDHPKPMWILAQRTGAEVCVKHPGFEEDLVVTCDRESLALWHAGRLGYREALAGGRLTVTGPRELVRSFPNWVPLSAFADVAPARV